jgi:hypothetical protein
MGIAKLRRLSPVSVSLVLSSPGAASVCGVQSYLRLRLASILHPVSFEHDLKALGHRHISLTLLLDVFGCRNITVLVIFVMPCSAKPVEYRCTTGQDFPQHVCEFFHPETWEICKHIVR